MWARPNDYSKNKTNRNDMAETGDEGARRNWKKNKKKCLIFFFFFLSKICSSETFYPENSNENFHYCGADSDADDRYARTTNSRAVSFGFFRRCRRKGAGGLYIRGARGAH